MSVWISLWWRGRTLSVACGDSSPEGESPWQRGQVSSSPVNGQEKSADKRKTFRPCQSLSLSGEVARRSRDGEGFFRDEPSQSPAATALPKGEPLAEPASFVHTGQRQKKPTDKPINFSPLPKPPPSGEVARRSRDGEGFSPSRCRFRESLFQIGAGAKSAKASIPPRKKSLDYCPGIFVVDGIGLEPMTSCTSSRCSTS